MTSPSRTPDRVRRSAAVVALLLALGFCGFAIADVIREPQWVVLALALMAMVPIALWYSVSRGGVKGRLAAVVTIVAFGAFVSIVIATSGWQLLVRASFLVMGHDVKALRVPGTAELIRRGTAWAAGILK